MNRDADKFVVAVPPPQLRQLTMLDRAGNTVGTIGQPGRFGDVRFSPDGKRLLTAKVDPETGINNIWVYDIATGKATAVTNETQSVNAPVWSRDGKYVAYVQFKDSYSSIYRKASDGTGNAELLFRYTPGAFIRTFRLVPRFEVSDFHHRRIADRAGANRRKRRSTGKLWNGYGRITTRSMANSHPTDAFWRTRRTKPMFARCRFTCGRLIPTSRPFRRAPLSRSQTLKTGADGIRWRQDGKEMYFLTRDRDVMAVDVTSTPVFKAGTPRALFRISDPLVGDGDVSPDGQRFVVEMPVR